MSTQSLLDPKLAERYKNLPWPESKNPAYRRTDLSFFRNGYEPQPQTFKVERFSADGARVTPLRQVRENSQFHSFLGRLISGEQDKLQALNALFAEEGVFVHVPQGGAPVQALKACFDLSAKEPRSSFFPRTVIVLEPESRAVYIEDWRGQAPQDAHVVSIAEIFLDKGAQLDYVVVQDLGSNMRSFHFEAAEIKENATLRIFHFELGARQRRIELFCDGVQPNAKSQITGVLLGQRDQSFDTHIIQQHSARGTISDMLWKAALKDSASNSFLGLIKILKPANHSQAFQAAHNLLLSSRARANPDPRLEIWANDVMAKHAATVGYLNEEQLFYLLSRGLDEKQAERLLTGGFLQEAIARAPQAVAAELSDRLEAMLA